jgi:hypothetical protein
MSAVVAGPGDPTFDLVQKVADVIPRRALEGDGRTGGTFDSNTSPTFQQVLRSVGNYLQDVTARVGGTVPLALADRAGDVAAIGAAAQIELAYFPELGTTVSDALFKRYDMAVTAFTAEVELVTGIDSPTDGGVSAGAFPDVCNDLDRILDPRPSWALGLPEHWPHPGWA